MKKKNTMPERDWQQTHEKIRWRELRKRVLVMGLTVAMVANTVDLSALSVSAKTDESESGKTTIVSFEELSKDITEQTLPIGALESDIKFPTSLTITVEKTTQADEKEADDEADASESEAGDTEKDDAQKDDGNGDTASGDKKDATSSDEKDGNSGNADASDKSGDSGNGNADAKDSDTSKDSGSSDKSGNTGASDKSDNTSTSDKSDSSNNSDKSNSSKGSSSSDSKSQNTGSDKSDKSASSGSSDKSNSSEGSNKSDSSNKSSSSDSSSKSDDSGRSSDTEDTQARADLPSAFGALIGQMADTLLPHKLIVHAAEKDDASDAASTSDSANDAKTTSAASDTTSSAKSVKTTGSADAAASSETETTTEKIRLKNIKWELNVEESDAEEFDSSEASNGFCYAYTPVLPDEDGDGNQLVLGKDVELPVIYVLVGQYGIALLDGNGTIEVTEKDADGNIIKTYNAQNLATWINDKKSAGLQKVSIKLLNNDTSITKELTIDTDLAKEIELDLDGHTLTLAGGARLYFKKVNITITSPDSNKGTITGNYNCGNKFKGDGLVTAERDSMLTIKHVTIENAGTGSTVAMWEGMTCTIDNASISGSSGDQAGTITIDKGKACTITNTEVTGNVGPDYGTIMFTDSCSNCTIGEGAVIENKNSGGYCVGFGSYAISASIKITIKKGAVLTANAGKGTIMSTSYGKVAVGIEGGSFNGRLLLPDNSQIAGGTFAPASGCAIEAKNSKKTLQNLLKVGYTLRYDNGTYADLTARWTDKGRKVTAVQSPLYFTTHPTISSGAETVMENYTAAEAPKLTVKAVSDSGSISYQWYADETINGTTTKVEQTGQGAKTATYKIPTGLSAGTYQYYCVATCGEYTATSKKAAFTVEEGVAEVTVGGNTTRYVTLTKAIAAIKDTVADGADLEITLKILKNISESESEWKIGGNTKKVSFCMDLNGCTVTGKGLSITGEGVEAVFKDTSAGKNGTLNAPISIQNKAKLTVENGNYEWNLNFSGGATGELKGGQYSKSIYIGKANSDNTGISCTITGGEYKGSEVLVYGGAALSVSGADTKIKTLQIDHSKNLRAEVTLSGGEYEVITLGAFFGSDDDLLDEGQRYAIEDTLADGYAFYSSGIKTDISRTEKTLNNVKVLPADTPEDVSLAVVKFQIEKNDGGTKTKYFLTWDAAMSCLEATESNLNNLQEYATWKKLEILLLKDAEASTGHVLANKKFLPAEITLRSEGDAPHSLTGKGNYLFMTGGQDVTIENINVVGNISFLGGTVGTQTQDAAVLRLGEGVTGLRNVAVTGKAEIVIEKGAEIPGTFTGDESNLDASIYCNHDTADISSKITKGTGKFKVWFPIELGGIALPTDGENDTNVTQRDGATYGLYSNGGTTDQKIKVTGEVCSYVPYGGNAVTIDTTDLSFTMPSSKVTLKAHTKDDYGYCSICGRTDLAEAYKKGYLHIEGLEGRTYDSYPQILSKITWKPVSGNVQELTKPNYGGGYGTLGFGGDRPSNNNADYTVVYKNNVEPYPLKQGDAGFDKEAAPQVTITGTGRSYIGSLTIYFTIGEGEMNFGDFGVCGADQEVPYTGKTHKAWDNNYKAILFKPDPYDIGQFTQLTEGEYIPLCDRTASEEWFGVDWENPTKVEYSTDNQQTWKTVIEYGQAGDVESPYMITDAGEYPFYIRVTNKDCGTTKVSEELKAKITPRALSEVTFNDDGSLVTAYYTGKPVIPTAWDDKLVDKGLKDETGTAAAPEYTLKKGTDFTITAEDNIDISTVGGVGTSGEKFAKATITGTGNYTGKLSAKFQIKSAFTLKQTTLSTAKWYREDPYYWKGDGVPVGFSETDVSSSSLLPSRSMKYIVCRADKEEAAGLSKDVEFYTSLEDAIADRNPGYTFKGEGSQTVKLWGKDPKTGYISEPVDVTLKIDTTAPTWADENGNTEGFGIQIKENWWRKLLNAVSFGHLYNNHTLEIKIKANDEKLGVNGVSGLDQNGARYYCYIQEIDDTAAGGEVAVKKNDELDQVQEGGSDITTSFIFVSSGLGNVGTVPPNSNALKNDGNYIVYAYAVDNAGNKSDYICTEGIVVDTQEPALTVSSESKIKDTEAAISVKLSEDATLLYFYVDEGLRNLKNAGSSSYADLATESTGKIWEYVQPSTKADGPLAKCENEKWKPPFAKSGEMVTIANIDGNAVTTPAYKIEAQKGTNEIQITGLQPSEKFQIWMAAIDKAGNFSGYSVSPFTTTKAMPKVTTLPEVSGVYGDKTADLKITKDGVAMYGDETITGTWKMNVQEGDTRTWQINDTGKCLVTFTPNASYGDTYEAAVVEVTPTIAPRPITIKVENMHRTYGEPFPGMEKLKFKIVSGTLADGDTETEFWKELDVRTDAEATKPDGAAGKWAFWIEEASTSGNYSIKVEGYYEGINDPAAVTRENGFLYTDKAQGKFVKLAGYQDNWSVSYGDAPFSLAVKTNNIHYNLPEYTVTDAKDANGNDIDKADIATRLLSVSREGEVTIKGAGSAKIKLLYPTAINYTEAEPLTVEVNIAQAYFNLSNIYRDFLFLRGGSDSIDMAALLPKDCGEITYGAVKTSDSKSILEGAPTISQDGKLSYAVKAGGAVGDEATITVPVSTANYKINNNNEIRIEIRLIDQLPVQPKGSISLKTDTLTYGEALSSLQFNSAAFTDKVSGKTVPGKLSFDEPDKKPDAGYYNAAWTFTPTDDAYAKCKGMVTVSVKKAVPKVVSVPVLEAYYYNPAGIAADWCQSHAQKPGEVRGADGTMLDGIWRFKEASLVPKLGTNAYPVIFTPTDTKNYETIEKTVTLTVKKAIPYISTQPTTANAYTHGDHLYNQAPTGAAIYGNGMGSAGTGTGANAPIAGTFKWKAPSTKLTYLGNTTFEYIFTPEDTASYETVTGSVTVTVEKAAKAPFMPGSEMNVAHSCETVGSVKLPQGWKWDDADAAKALVEDDGTGSNVTSATAVYDGADKGSYVTETVMIQITRANCEHAKKEVKGAVKATCIAEGTTGETWCQVCGKKLDDGVATPKDTANHTNLVSKQLRPATTTQEGIMSYACSDCGYYAEKAIEKLASGGSSSTGSSSGHHSGSSGSSSGRKDSTAEQPAKPTPAPTPTPMPVPTPAPAPAPAQPANPIRPQGNAPVESGEQAMPFIRGEDGKEGWDVIKAEAAVRAEGEVVTVDMNGASVVPGDVFDEIRGKDVTIEFDLGGGISWSVNGKSVSDKVGDIDFRVTYGEEASDTIPVDIINALTGERASMNVTLAYEGRFGFEAVLRINVGAANKGLVANLFYYNESTGELEFISAGEVDEEGFAYLSFTHASDYTIVLDETSMEEAALADTTGAAGSDGAESTAATTSEDTVKDSPDTESRAALIWLIAFAGIAAAAAVGVVAVKKRKEEK